METKANYVAVGAFSLFLIGALVAAVFWVRGGSSSNMVRLDIEINGAVTGLSVGSVVLFNGIEVGKVTQLRLDATNPRVVIAQTQVVDGLPITQDTRAFLGFTGLTGIAHVEFEGSAIAEKSVFDIANETGEVARIQAEPSAFNDIIATAQRVFQRVDSVMDEVDVFIGDARAPLTATLKNTERFSASLADNADQIDVFLESIGSLGNTLDEVSGTLSQVLTSVDGLVNAVDAEKIGLIVDNIDRFTADLTFVVEDMKTLAETANASLQEFEGTGTRVNGALDRIDGVLAAVDPDAVDQTIGNVLDTTEAALQAADDIAALTSTFGDREEDIASIVTNVTQMAERLNAASVRVDGVLAKVDGFLGEADGEDLFGEVAATLTSFRQVADTLNNRLDGITANLERFSGRGLRDVEALVSDTRRSINRIESAISGLERNPQRLLFGGEGDVKRFDERQRR
ncbi:MAG: MlaD family protein [Ahrensia sp.]